MCARLVDLAEGNPPKREVEGADLVCHVAEEHASWLECSASGDGAKEAEGGA